MENHSFIDLCSPLASAIHAALPRRACCSLYLRSASLGDGRGLMHFFKASTRLLSPRRASCHVPRRNSNRRTRAATPTTPTTPPAPPAARFSTSSGYASVSDADLDFFRGVVGPDHVKTEDLEGFNTDWMKKYRGASPVAVLPGTTDQVSRVLRRCDERRIAVVPQGGNTGLVGGSVPAGREGVGEVVLSTSRMDSVVAFDPLAGVLTCEAGCILETLDAYLADQGFAMPLDLGAKGSCQIGGNVSTNAGGLRLLRYGSLHGSVLGLEVVLANGTILDLLSANRKDNTGYALRHLFIGAEGTLGVVTRCALAVPPRPASVSVALLALSDFDGVEGVLGLARGRLAEVLSAAEFMDKETVALTLEKCGGVRSPFPPPGIAGSAGGGGGRGGSSGGGEGGGGGQHEFYVLIETSGSDAAHDAEKLEGFLEAAMELDSFVDGAVAQDLTQLHSMWSLREHAPLAASLAGYTYKYDVSVPVRDFKALADETRRRLRGLPSTTGVTASAASEVKVVAYGHLGDGNLHLNVCVPAAAADAAGGGNAEVLAALEPFVFEWVVSRGGSISAEHGVGQHKRDYLTLQRPPAVLEAMRGVKDLLDPRGIMNPFKVLPEEPR